MKEKRIIKNGPIVDFIKSKYDLFFIESCHVILIKTVIFYLCNSIYFYSKMLVEINSE